MASSPKVICVIMGGGRGTRLYPLTASRCKPAVPLAGKYRLIDIPISNCLNSGFNNIYILTQFNTASLHHHIQRTYKLDVFGRGCVDILAAEQNMESEAWYQGTADAVRHNLQHFMMKDNDLMLILSGDQLFRMDFRPMIRQHLEKKADVTIAAKAMPKAEIIRVMPNLNCLVGASASAFSCASSVTEAHRESVRLLLSASGTATEVEEPLLDAVTGLSGSGPAFAARLMSYFIHAGEEAGLSRKTAVELTRQTFLGTVRFLNETGIDEETLIERVSSPGGTTVAGRQVLESSEAERIVRDTVAAAVERSRELGKM